MASLSQPARGLGRAGAARLGGAWVRVAVASVGRDAWLRGAGVLALLTLLAVFFTWPLAARLSTHTVWHIDPPFSVWRLAWIAHQLFTDPRHLFDGNIFHPELRTLAYSDAMLFEGLLATPFIKAGVPPLLVMNVLLLVGMIGSGGGMYLLARRLTGNTAAATLAAIVFSFAAYRADHVMHLELQWAPWIPLTLWAFHRTIADGRLRDGLLTGVFILLQLLSSIYYALFLMVALAIAGTLSVLLWRSRLTRRAAIGLAIGGVLLAAIAVPYSRPYRENAGTLGVRPEGEIQSYSATPASYFAVTPDHVLYGDWTGAWSNSETRLFPGFVAVVLAGLAFLPPVCATRWLYLAVLAVAVEASFGLNGWLYPLLHEWLTPFKGLRVPGRFGILVLLAVGVLAAYGAVRVLHVVPAAWRRPTAVLLGGVMMLEYQTAPAYMEPLPVDVPSVYRWLAREPRTVTLELPTPDLESLPYMEPLFMYLSTMHWQPLVNGYSGHYPHSYLQLLRRLETFPDDASMAALRGHGIGAIVMHRELYLKPHEYDRAYAALEARPDVQLMGVWKDHKGDARAYRILSAPASGTK